MKHKHTRAAVLHVVMDRNIEVPQAGAWLQNQGRAVTQGGSKFEHHHSWCRMYSVLSAEDPLLLVLNSSAEYRHSNSASFLSIFFSKWSKSEEGKRPGCSTLWAIFLWDAAP